MQTKPTVIFDMDGVLLDSANAIVESLRFALSELNEKNLANSNLRRFVGPPLHAMASELLPHVSDDMRQSFMSLYRQHNNQYGPDLTPVFDGVIELLSDLQSDFDLVVATSKLESAAVQVLQMKKIDRYFMSIFGTRPNTSDSKADVIGRAIEGIDPSSIVAMVGDRVHDVEGANAHGLRSIGVTWGYALPGELEIANPAKTVDSTIQLGQVIREMSLI